MAQSRAVIWIRNTMVGLVALTFVVLFGLPTGGSSQRAIAEVDGVIVERDAFEFFRRVLADRQRQALPEDFDAQRFREMVDSLTRDRLIQRYVLAGAAESLGLTASRAELLADIRSDPGFQRNGSFDPDIYDSFVSRSEFDNEGSYLGQLRHDVLIRKLGRLLQSPIRISDAAARDRLTRDQTTVRLRYAAARAGDFPTAQVSDADVQAMLQGSPERLQSAYESRYDEFNQPERVRARHMLFRGEDAAEKADAARARLAGGEDFVALAVEISEDAATSERGGDLGSFPRGRMLPELDEAAFSAPPRTVTGPVKSQRGLHLIRVEEKLPAVARPLAEVQEALARDLLAEEGGAGLARQSASAMAERLRAGSAFDEAAAGAGLKVEETTPFRVDSPVVPGMGRVPGLRQAAFALRPDDPVSKRVFASGDAFYLVALAERREPDLDTLRDEVPIARDRLQREARNLALDRFYRGLRQRLQAEGKLLLYPLYPDGS